jgi:hypothetical protein
LHVREMGSHTQILKCQGRAYGGNLCKGKAFLNQWLKNFA